MTDTFKRLEYDWRAQSQPKWTLLMLWKCFMLAFRVVLMSIVILNVPFLARKIVAAVKGKKKKTPAAENITVTFTYKTITTEIKSYTTEIFQRSAIVGKEAPNLKLVDVKTEKMVKLLYFQKHGRPLIVNFGSCT
jgi:hypothetical protein